ncbi:hypothetical protein GGR92_004398 [Spirosoma lacussanchae]|uniref:DUF5990 family protein n=1 Tax=Spirosoma lacussanchae TaxID=1884249 RepID=UPI001107BAA0|nr:DUF5990 family protein [Spirosoma lacussanchae]
MANEINLKILLQNPVDGLVYGLQKGKGVQNEIVQAQIGNGRDLTFRFVIHLKQPSESALSLTGPFVQGPPGNRFVYITIGSYAGQAGTASNGRLKVPLPEAAFQDALARGSAYGWSCKVPGSTKDGKPVYATVKPFGGWVMEKLSDQTGT